MTQRHRRVVLAPDKFKGSLTAPEVAAALATGIARVAPEAEIRQLPVADGGDGTVDIFVAAGWERIRVAAVGPTGAPTTASYAVRDGTAVVELAEVVGLVKLPGAQFDPMYAGTYGLGLVLRDALDRGYHEIVLGLGGSASSDGGAGMLHALGLRILDADDNELPWGAAPLRRAHRIDYSGLHPAVASTTFTLASDVDNPLLGPHGAAAVFAPQKGADREQCAEIEAALSHWAELVRATRPATRGVAGDGAGTGRGRDRAGSGVTEPDGEIDFARRPGAGAAGGTGFGAMAVLGARPRPGIEVVLELIGFSDAVRGADLVVTGEGALDEQTLRGKAPAGVAAAARGEGVTVVAVAGRCALSPERLRVAGIADCYPLTDLEPDPARSVADAAPLLSEIGARIAADHLR